MNAHRRLNRSQRLGLDVDRHVAISAGAGTGKTTVMSLRYIEHLLNITQRATLLLPQSPRRPVHGPGSLRAPKREQQDLESWGGLLPTECVAITFTNDAADELRQRIREGLVELRRRGEDPRVTRTGLIEQMLSLLDDAPIGTIDSFFSSLLGPWRGSVSDDPTHEHLSDESRPLLSNQAISAAWRIRSRDDAFELGMGGEHAGFIQARDRLSTGLGTRWAARRVVEELLKQSLFVEEAETSIRRITSAGSTPTEAAGERVRSLILDIAASGSSRLPELLHLAEIWLDGCTTHGHSLDLADALGATSRYAAFDGLVRAGLPDDDWLRLQWLHHFEAITTSESSMRASTSKAMPRGFLPNRDADWPSGINGLTAIPKDEKESARQNIVEVGARISSLLSEPEFRHLRWMGYCAWLFDPSFACPSHPSGPLRGVRTIEAPLPITHPGGRPIASLSLQVGLLDDLFSVQHGVQAILRHMKTAEGVHDHSDVQRMAEDLLLARCPDVCRNWYPPAVVAALDSIDERPWIDVHVERALSLAEGEPSALADLQQRFENLRRLRRRFRVFIIDEYQDTNPQQFRLLARLFGRRAVDRGETEPPAGEWDPTVCVVGDPKQSIFRFRQAQVAVMLRTIDAIRQMNRIEMESEPRLAALRAQQGVEAGFGRDPRPLPRKEGSEVFVTASAYDRIESGSDESVLSLSLDDDGRQLDHIEQVERAEGCIKLSKNYRTHGGLLRTMNHWFDDLFDENHDLIEGEWHARPQALSPSDANRDLSGHIDWLMPVSSGMDQDPPSDLGIPLDPFALGASAKPHEREHELLAARLHSLINAHPYTLLNGGEDGQKMMHAPPSAPVRAEEIMVLLAKRTHLDDLMERLQRWGIPAVADKQGGLLDQPVVRCLQKVLRASAMPDDAHSVAAFARCELACFSDSELQRFVQAPASDETHLRRLGQHACSPAEAELFSRIDAASSSGRVIELLEEIIDQSDLLTIFPEVRHRQQAEQFTSLARRLSEQVGGDPVLLSNRLEELGHEGGDIESRAIPTSGAVRVMTIHAAKGLQSKVVAVVGLFAAGHHSFTFTTSSKLIVTPEMMASRLAPWLGHEPISSGAWELAKLLIQSQIQAEARRLLYVALTRVEQHLILVGSSSSNISGDGSRLTLKAEASDNPSLGIMLLSAISSASEDDVASPWLAPAPKGELELAPSELYHSSHLGGELQSISIFHSLDCFSQVPEPSTPLLEADRHALAISEVERTTVGGRLPARDQRLRIAPHRLDAAGECRRRHWLQSSLGFESEALRMHPATDPSPASGFPDPASFGTLFHRLVEVGIGNPGAASGSDLPSTWLRPQRSRLMEDGLLDEILQELLPADADAALTGNRLSMMAELLEDGPLGRLCAGEEVAGLSVDGLMTEWPFECGLEVSTDAAGIEHWTPFGSRRCADANTVMITFSGRIDLVLALRDITDGERYLMAVDIKTEGGLHGFNQDDSESGHPLQRTPSEMDDLFLLTDAEADMLFSHSLQLSLYDRILGLVQSHRESGQARAILPPAIYVAASGRLISWKPPVQKEQDGRLDELLRWMATASVSSEIPQGVERLPQSESAVCGRCPFNLGEIRLCGPQGEPLGAI